VTHDVWRRVTVKEGWMAGSAGTILSGPIFYQAIPVLYQDIPTPYLQFTWFFSQLWLLSHSGPPIDLSDVLTLCNRLLKASDSMSDEFTG
jgi:hypothetical protein